MGRFYNNSQPLQSSYCTDGKPMDDRTVVSTQEDLMLESTWTGRYLYSGIIVAVIRDPDPKKNGLYWLSHKNNFMNQCWNKNGDSYGHDGKGWYRVAFLVFDTDPSDTTDPPGSFGGDGTMDNPIYVNTINGGEFPSNN